MSDLIALDIGIHYLGDPWGYYALSKQDRVELQAYWRIQHTENRSRWLLSGGCTLSDAYAMLKLSKGKTPRGLFNRQRMDPKVVKHWTGSTATSPQALSWWSE